MVRWFERTCVGVLAFLVVFFWLVVKAFSISYPEYGGFVNDFANLLSPQAKQNLESELSQYEQKTTHEIAVVTINSLEGEPIEDYVVGLEEKWKVGKEGKDNGVIFLVAKDDRKMRIEVGYGLEGDLTDGDAGEIIRDVVAPEFRANRFEQGILLGTRAILNELDKGKDDVDNVVGNNPVRRDGGDTVDDLVSLVGPFIYFIPMIFIYLISYMSRTKSIMAGGILGGLGGVGLGLLLGTVGGLFMSGIIGAIFGFILDAILSRNYQQNLRNGRNTNWFNTWGGFSGGGWSSGSRGGFGGFGGGSSGGGGASGDW